MSTENVEKEETPLKQTEPNQVEVRETVKSRRTNSSLEKLLSNCAGAIGATVAEYNIEQDHPDYPEVREEVVEATFSDFVSDPQSISRQELVDELNDVLQFFPVLDLNITEGDGVKVHAFIQGD